MKNTMFMKLCTLVISLVLTLGIIVVPCYAATDSATSFKDVPQDHWAISEITEAAQRGWVNGIGDGLFAPDTKVTQGQWLTMLTRAVYPQEVDAANVTNFWYANKWYAKSVQVTRNKGLMRLLPFDILNEAQIDLPLCRKAMACTVGAVLQNFNKDMSEEQYQALAQQIPDIEGIKAPADYSRGVLLSYQYKILSGVDSTGRFNGSGAMTRAQAAAILCRLANVLGIDSSFQATPETIPDPESNSGVEIIPDHWSEKSAGIKAVSTKDAYNAAVQSLKDIKALRVHPEQAVQFKGTNNEVQFVRNALSLTGLLHVKNRDGEPTWVPSDFGLTEAEKNLFLRDWNEESQYVLISAASAMLNSEYSDGYFKEDMAKKMQAYLNLAGVPSIFYKNSDVEFGDASTNYWLFTYLNGSWTTVWVNKVCDLYWENPSLIMIDQYAWQFDSNFAPVEYLNVINRDGSLENLAMHLIQDANNP